MNNVEFESKQSTIPAPQAPSPTKTIGTIIFLLLEIVCVVLMLNSLRTISVPTWAEKKLAEIEQQPKTQVATAADPASTAPAVETEAVSVSEAPTETVSATDANTTTVVSDTGQKTATAGATSSKELEMVLSSVFGVLPDIAAADYQITPELVDLGRMLYYDTRLSVSNTVSCNTCHLLDQYGIDGLPQSIGTMEIPVDRNAPTVYNAALHISQFWDGRSPDVEDQATGPIMASGEMGMVDAEAVNNRLAGIPGYAAMFKAAFPDARKPINLKNIGIAIGAFERGLITPAPFDRFLAGDRSALNEQEQRGLATFISMRCVTCHIGSTVGGQSYKQLGEYYPYPTKDLGRYNITKNEEDRHVFKVPSLRNIAKTGPYLHDGSIASLDEMVRLMARYQLGKTPTEQEVEDIVAFLEALTGEIPLEYIKEPELPVEAADSLTTATDASDTEVDPSKSNASANDKDTGSTTSTDDASATSAATTSDKATSDNAAAATDKDSAVSSEQATSTNGDAANEKTTSEKTTSDNTATATDKESTASSEQAVNSESPNSESSDK